jgi:hypothetical protein
VGLLLVAFIVWILFRRRQKKDRLNEVNAYNDIETVFRSEAGSPFGRTSIPMPPASYAGRASVRPSSPTRLTLRSVDIMAPRVMSGARIAQHQPVWRIVREDPFADPRRDPTGTSADPFRDPTIGRAVSRDSFHSARESGLREFRRPPSWGGDQKGKLEGN